MENKEIEEIYNLTFGGLTLFYRDANLTENLISKYEVGQILLEKGFTDMSYKGGGITTNCRFLIASAFGKDVSSIMPETMEFGRRMLKSSSCFKVLDIYRIDNKTQIFLLNIPESTIDFFQNVTSNIEKDITEKARESFDNKINLEPISELQKKDWKDLTDFPIGMSDKGIFFYQSKEENPKSSQNNDTEKIKNVEVEKNKPWWKFW